MSGNGIDPSAVADQVDANRRELRDLRRSQDDYEAKAEARHREMKEYIREHFSQLQDAISRLGQSMANQ